MQPIGHCGAAGCVHHTAAVIADGMSGPCNSLKSFRRYSGLCTSLETSYSSPAFIGGATGRVHHTSAIIADDILDPVIRLSPNDHILDSAIYLRLLVAAQHPLVELLGVFITAAIIAGGILDPGIQLSLTDSILDPVLPLRLLMAAQQSLVARLGVFTTPLP